MALRLKLPPSPSVRFSPTMGRGSVRGSTARRRRSTAAAFAAALAAAALAVAGCGAETHPNHPRPQSPTRVSVTISDHKVIVAPTEIGFGKEKTQQIPQNQNQPQPVIKGDEGPLDVIFVAANQSDTDSHLEIDGPKEATSEAFPASSPGTFQTELPAGNYTISASDIPGAKPAKLVVGSIRTSSENDVLLP
jgi:hypothetical protein